MILEYNYPLTLKVTFCVFLLTILVMRLWGAYTRKHYIIGFYC